MYQLRTLAVCDVPLERDNQNRWSRGVRLLDPPTRVYLEEHQRPRIGLLLLHDAMPLAASQDFPSAAIFPATSFESTVNKRYQRLHISGLLIRDSD